MNKRQKVEFFIILIALVGFLIFGGCYIWFQFGPSAVVTTSCNGTISKIIACPDCTEGISKYFVVFKTASGDVILVDEKLSKEIIDSGAYLNQVLRITYKTEELRDRAGKTSSRRHRLVQWRKPYPIEIGK